MGGVREQRAVRGEGQLSGPIIDTVFEPRCGQIEHRVFLEKEGLGLVGIKQCHFY